MSQSRHLRLQNLSQKEMLGGRKVTAFINNHTFVFSIRTPEKSQPKNLSICIQMLKESYFLTAVGDTVSEDEVVCEIETDKVKLSKCDTN